MSGGSEMIARHIAALEALEGKTVEAGWFESAKYEDGTSVSEVARKNEFGGVGEDEDGSEYIVPARAFMRLAYKWILRDSQALQKQMAKKLFAGKITADQILGQIGVFMEGKIVESIKSNDWEGPKHNSPETIERKGFDKPLIHTAHMWQSVSSKVTSSQE